MLRWLFLIVVVLNVAAFAWFEREQQTRSQLMDRPQGFGQHVSSLTLTSEVERPLRPRAVGPSPLSEASPASSIGEQTCIRITNFPSQEAMLAWQATLPAEVAVMTSDEISGDEYLVYIEPTGGGLQERERLLQALRSLGLEVSLIQRGDLKGSISLGRYSDRELAVSLYEGVLSQGYAGRLLPVGTNVAELGLWISLTEALSDDLTWLDNLLLGTSYLKSEKKVC